MNSVCDVEKYIDAQIDREIYSKRAYKTEIKCQFHLVFDDLLYEAINDFIDKENEYTEGQRKIIEHIWKYMRKKIENT